jgi:hypothetical protein
MQKSRTTEGYLFFYAVDDASFKVRSAAERGKD